MATLDGKKRKNPVDIIQANIINTHRPNIFDSIIIDLKRNFFIVPGYVFLVRNCSINLRFHTLPYTKIRQMFQVFWRQFFAANVGTKNTPFSPLCQ